MKRNTDSKENVLSKKKKKKPDSGRWELRGSSESCLHQAFALMPESFYIERELKILERTGVRKEVKTEK